MSSVHTVQKVTPVFKKTLFLICSQNIPQMALHNCTSPKLIYTFVFAIFLSLDFKNNVHKYSKVSIIRLGCSRLLEFEKKIVLVVYSQVSIKRARSLNSTEYC